MKQEKTLKQPYEAPQGYFDGFNERVMQKVAHDNSKKLYWQVNRSFLYAAAAILAIIGVGLYKMFKQPETRVNPMVHTHKTEKSIDTVALETTTNRDEKLLQHWEEEAVAHTAVKVAETPKNTEELSIEEELEAAGLIARDVETEWLDENEIIP